MKNFRDLLEIAKKNVKDNPSIFDSETGQVSKRYLDALGDEVVEVTEELRENNAVKLEDELSDIAWVYGVLLALCEDRGLIDSVDDVINHAYKKYTERTPAFLEASAEMWEEIKKKQNSDLANRHQERYGKT